MKISGRFVTVTDSRFVPDRLVIFEGEAITFKLELTGDNPVVGDVYQVFLKFLKVFFSFGVLVEIFNESQPKRYLACILRGKNKDEILISAF